MANQILRSYHFRFGLLILTGANWILMGANWIIMINRSACVASYTDLDRTLSHFKSLHGQIAALRGNHGNLSYHFDVEKSNKL